MVMMVVVVFVWGIILEGDVGPCPGDPQRCYSNLLLLLLLQVASMNLFIIGWGINRSLSRR